MISKSLLKGEEGRTQSSTLNFNNSDVTLTIPNETDWIGYNPNPADQILFAQFFPREAAAKEAGDLDSGLTQRNDSETTQDHAAAKSAAFLTTEKLSSFSHEPQTPQEVEKRISELKILKKLMEGPKTKIRKSRSDKDKKRGSYKKRGTSKRQWIINGNTK